MFSAAIRWAVRNDLVERTGSESRAWTLVAARVFGAAGLLSATVVSLGIVALLAAVGGLGGLGPVTPTLLGGLALWFAAPTVGSVVTAGPAWYGLVERIGDGRDAGDERSWRSHPVLGGLSGAIGGVLAHFVMWLILVVTYVGYQVVQGTSTVTSPAEPIWIGLLAGLFSLLFTGWITVPALAAAGAKLGSARDLHDLAGSDRSPEASGGRRTRWASTDERSERSDTRGERIDGRDDRGERENSRGEPGEDPGETTGVSDESETTGDSGQNETNGTSGETNGERNEPAANPDRDRPTATEKN